MVSGKHILLIFLGIILVGLIVAAAIFGDPIIIIFLIIAGIVVFFTIFSFILEEFFPKNKISKTLENISEWILDSIHF